MSLCVSEPLASKWLRMTRITVTSQTRDFFHVCVSQWNWVSLWQWALVWRVWTPFKETMYHLLRRVRSVGYWRRGWALLRGNTPIVTNGLLSCAVWCNEPILCHCTYTDAITISLETFSFTTEWEKVRNEKCLPDESACTVQFRLHALHVWRRSCRSNTLQ